MSPAKKIPCWYRYTSTSPTFASGAGAGSDQLRVGLWLAPAAPADTVKATTATGIYLVIWMKLPLFLARF
jgi:hypothetical protein